MKFVNRHTEKAALEKLSGSGSAVIFGRRRVGKTALVQECIKNKPHVFYQGVKLPAPMIYKELGMLMGEKINNTALKSGEIKDISTILDIFAENCKGWTLILDEFGYMVESDPALPSIVQRFLDKEKRKIGLFLTGSTYSIIEKLMGEKSPLWGRVDTSLEIKPLAFIYSKDFWEGLPFLFRAGLYGALGGIPYNWERARTGADLFSTLAHTFFLPDSPLYREVHYILREELREPKLYMAVLQAIAAGRRRFSEIADVAAVPVSNISKYLDVLRNMNLIKQEIPVGEKPTTRKGLWKINDPMIRFWFKFVFPARHMIEIDAGMKAVEHIKENWDDYMGPIYEDIALQLTREMIKRGELPFVTGLGRWWDKEREFDIVGLNGKRVILLGEVKWGHFSAGDLRKFQQKMKNIPFERDKNIQYVLFSGKGFQTEIPPGFRAICGDKF